MSGPKTASVLELEQLSCRFGQVHAVDGVTTTVAEGEVRGLIGPNGAGKTTLINAVSGFVGHTGGHLTLDGRRIDRLAPQRRVRAGLRRTFQTPQTSLGLSVRDNLIVGAHLRFRCAGFSQLVRLRDERRASVRSDAEAVAADVGLGDLLDVPAASLSYGQLRLLEIGRALIEPPRVLLLDEPVAGMNEVERDQVAEVILAARDRGATVLLVDHDMPFVMETCDRITVLHLGRVLAEGEPAEVRADAQVEEVYLGTGSRER